MHVEVKLHGVLRRYRPENAGGAPHHPFTLSLPAMTTIDLLVVQLQIPDGLVNAAAQNGEAVNETAVLQDGDKVALFPPSAGG